MLARNKGLSRKTLKYIKTAVVDEPQVKMIIYIKSGLKGWLRS